MAVRSCWIWWELEHAVVHIDPKHPKHAQWVTCLVSMQAMEELGHVQLTASRVVQTHSFISCPGGWSQMIPQVKTPDAEVLDWRSYTWTVVVRPVERTAKFSKTVGKKNVLSIL